MSKDKRSEKLSSYQGMQKKFPLSSPLHIAWRDQNQVFSTYFIAYFVKIHPGAGNACFNN